MTTYRLWPATNGPASPVAFSGNFISGTVFFVTGEAWFQGYWWWVCPSGQLTTPRKCALWQIDRNAGAHLVPGSVVTSGTLTAGQWNFIPLPAPVPLSLGGSTGTASQSAVNGVEGCAEYIAAIGVNGAFPDTTNYWGAGQVAPNGITNGPLTAYSSPGGGMPSPYPVSHMAQGVFTVGGSDPSINCPENASNTDNFWVDVQVADYATAVTAPFTTALRLWPSFPTVNLLANNDTTLAMSGTAFTLSQSCKLSKIWQFNPASSTGFPSRVGIWAVATKTVVAGTDNASPSWLNSSNAAATAGDGWCYVDYSSTSPVLTAGTYIVAFFNGSGVRCYTDSPNVFFTGTDPVGGLAVGGPGWNGISWGGGILTAPNVASGPLLVYDDSSGTKPGQTAYQPGPTTWTYPSEFEASSDWGESRFADVELIPLAPAAGNLQQQQSGRSMMKKRLWYADV